MKPDLSTVSDLETASDCLPALSTSKADSFVDSTGTASDLALQTQTSIYSFTACFYILIGIDT